MKSKLNRKAQPPLTFPVLMVNGKGTVVLMLSIGMGVVVGATRDSTAVLGTYYTSFTMSNFSHYLGAVTLEND